MGSGVDKSADEACEIIHTETAFSDECMDVSDVYDLE